MQEIKKEHLKIIKFKLLSTSNNFIAKIIYYSNYFYRQLVYMYFSLFGLSIKFKLYPILENKNNMKNATSEYIMIYVILVQLFISIIKYLYNFIQNKNTLVSLFGF